MESTPEQARNTFDIQSKTTLTTKSLGVIWSTCSRCAKQHLGIFHHQFIAWVWHVSKVAKMQSSWDRSGSSRAWLGLNLALFFPPLDPSVLEPGLRLNKTKSLLKRRLIFPWVNRSSWPVVRDLLTKREKERQRNFYVFLPCKPLFLAFQWQSASEQNRGRRSQLKNNNSFKSKLTKKLLFLLR